MLKASLERQRDVDIECFYYYNNIFLCAAQAYNDAIDKTSSEVMVFVHQDIRFDDDFFLKNLYEMIIQNKRAIYGLCGAVSTQNGTITYSNVFHGLLRRNIGEHIIEPRNVEGLDEIFVAMHIETARKLRFDEKVVNGWHMFVENLCLDAHEKDYGVMVYPGKATHKNDMEMPGYMMAYKLFPKEFFKYVHVVRNKHKGSTKKIVCPCITIKTDPMHFYPMFYIMKYKTVIMRWIRALSMK